MIKILRLIIVSAVLLLLASVSLVSQEGNGEGDLPPLNTVINEEYTLKTIASAVERGEGSQIPQDKYLIIDGLVSSRQVLEADEEDYFGILELSTGSWDEEGDLNTYRCYFQLKGEKFYGTIPEGRSREKAPKEIPLHSHVVAVGRYLGYGEDEEGNMFPVLEAVMVRSLKN
ncbi:MAG: hypothetical protein R6V67_10515 [Spirochaetia bacterium]